MFVIDSRDIAASVVPEYAQSWDKAVERRVVRKIDLFLIPFMWVGYGLVYYDKVRRNDSLRISGTINTHITTGNSRWSICFRHDNRPRPRRRYRPYH
jgi:hypothetical protein